MRYFFLLLSISFLFFSCSNNKPPSISDSVAKKWKYVSIKDISGNTAKQVSDSDYFYLGAAGNAQTFNYDLAKENIHSSGNWQIQDSTLVLTYDLKPAETEIDSSSYRVTDKNPELILFNEGKEITKITPEGLQSDHVVRKFHVLVCNDNDLVIEEKGITFSLHYTSVIPESNISFYSLFRGMIGILVLVLILYSLSTNRKAISWKLVISGILFQIIFAIGVLKVSFIKAAFDSISNFFVIVLKFTREGSGFLFGSLLDVNSNGFLFAFQILPTIIFFSALTSMLFYLGILQKIVHGLAWMMGKAMKISGAENLSTAANIFLGQTEAPLMIRHFLPQMTRSEILCIMIGGMANTAGGVLAAYVGFLGGADPVQQLFFAKHLLAASVMSAPATIVVSKMMIPQTEQIDETLHVSKEKIGTNLLEAIANGTTDGIKLAVNVAGMLIVFIALIAMVNYTLNDFIGNATGLNSYIEKITHGRYHGFTLQFMLGYICAPISFLIGVCKEDMIYVGQLLGEKTILNEFVAYISLSEMKSLFHEQKSIIMATYILSGFANFASIGIQIGGIGSLAPNKRSTLAQLGIKALIGGTICSLFTAAIVGMLM